CHPKPCRQGEPAIHEYIRKCEHQRRPPVIASQICRKFGQRKEKARRQRESSNFGQTSDAAWFSYQQPVYDFRRNDASQFLIEALEAVSQFFVINPELMKDRSVQVTNVNGIFDDVVAKVVSFAIDDSRF